MLVSCSVLLAVENRKSMLVAWRKRADGAGQAQGWRLGAGAASCSASVASSLSDPFFVPKMPGTKAFSFQCVCNEKPKSRVFVAAKTRRKRLRFMGGRRWVVVALAVRERAPCGLREGALGAAQGSASNSRWGAPAALGSARRKRLRFAKGGRPACGQPAGGSREGRRRAVGAILLIVSLCAAWASAASAARDSRIWPLSAAGELRLPEGLPGGRLVSGLPSTLCPGIKFYFCGGGCGGAIGLTIRAIQTII